jgi:hypothetical protein
MFPKEHAPRAITNTLGGIDPKQRIDVAGAHKFIAAGSDDFRGPCPGLNALANHNYIPRNGIVSVLEAIIVSFNGVFPENMNDTAPTYRRAVFGLGPDIGLVAGILALYGADLLDIPFFDFSIGGPPPSLLGILFGL